MFPEEVKFNWLTENQNGKNEDLKGVETLEQRDKDSETQLTSMLIVDKHKVKTNKFICSIQHVSNLKEQRVDIPALQEEGNALLVFH